MPARPENNVKTSEVYVKISNKCQKHQINVKIVENEGHNFVVKNISEQLSATLLIKLTFTIIKSY